jgi:hypothetical protein
MPNVDGQYSQMGSRTRILRTKRLQVHNHDREDLGYQMNEERKADTDEPKKEPVAVVVIDTLNRKEYVKDKPVPAFEGWVNLFGQT